jgi:hypothetical protein
MCGIFNKWNGEMINLHTSFATMFRLYEDGVISQRFENRIEFPSLVTCGQLQQATTFQIVNKCMHPP